MKLTYCCYTKSQLTRVLRDKKQNEFTKEMMEYYESLDRDGGIDRCQSLTKRKFQI
jgi:hypothetical protein